MRVTMRDVAVRAGVSLNTVSRVVNNLGEVSDPTRQRILVAIEELGFRPNGVARSLASGESLSVALVIPQITDPFYPEVLLGVESIARQHRYSVLLCNTNNDPKQELEYTDILAIKQVDGIIFGGSRLDADQLSQVAARHPVVCVSSRIRHDAAVVSMRGEYGLCEITSHLIRLGHRKIGHVGYCSPTSGYERVDGHRHALQEHGISAGDQWVVLGDQGTVESGHAAGRHLLTQAPEITAVSCFNDLMAIGVMEACSEIGARVPDDVAVVGFDDLLLASMVTPKLTTMHVPRFRLGELAMELLLRVIAAGNKHEEHVSVDPELVVRESCGAHRNAAWLSSQQAASQNASIAGSAQTPQTDVSAGPQ